MKNLTQYGWNDYFEAQFAEFSSDSLLPARVSLEHRNYYELYTELGELTAQKSGKLFYISQSSNDLPAVGDWVVIKPIEKEKKAVITAVLPRRSKFSRKKAGITIEEQIVAANVDCVFVMSSLNQDLNMRRIDRYLTLAWDNNIKPIIILSKADLCAEMYERLVEVENYFPAADAHVISAKNGAGVDDLYIYFEGNKTIACVGSSGVGKSTLINRFLNQQKMHVSEIGHYKDKGKHITTHRELVLVPGGGLIIDTPGMREIQIWEGGEGLSELFEDIEALALECKFSDCRHESEPGCAIKEAIRRGEITRERFKSYRKLLKEVGYFERKQNHKLRLEEKKKWKKISVAAKKIGKEKYGE